jgi:hypothetical protein
MAIPIQRLRGCGNMMPFVVWYVREKDARNHFAARGVELVHLVSSVCLVCVVRRTRETR